MYVRPSFVVAVIISSVFTFAANVFNAVLGVHWAIKGKLITTKALKMKGFMFKGVWLKVGAF